MLKFRSIVLGIAFLVCATSSTSHAVVKFGVAGVIDYGLNSATTDVLGVTIESTGGLGFGGGILAKFGMGPAGFELGALFISQTENSTANGVALPSTSSPIFHFPAVYHFGLGKSFSLGIGGYFALALAEGGDSDYGLKAGPRISFGKFFVDATYNYGLKDNSGVKNSELIGLLGIMF